MQLFTREEVRKHCTRTDCWIVVDRCVYDITEYVSRHPGGAGVLLEYAGRDCTEMFESVHPWVSHGTILREYFLGHV